MRNDKDGFDLLVEAYKRYSDANIVSPISYSGDVKLNSRFCPGLVILKHFCDSVYIDGLPGYVYSSKSKKWADYKKGVAIDTNKDMLRLNLKKELKGKARFYPLYPDGTEYDNRHTLPKGIEDNLLYNDNGIYSTLVPGYLPYLKAIKKHDYSLKKILAGQPLQKNLIALSSR